MKTMATFQLVKFRQGQYISTKNTLNISIFNLFFLIFSKNYIFSPIENDQLLSATYFRCLLVFHLLQLLQNFNRHYWCFY